MTVPVWLAATSGQPGLAGQVNQFLVTHEVTYVYTGTQQSHQATAGSGGVNSNGLLIAQSFSTAPGQTAVGYVTVTATATGSPPPWVLSIQADNGSGAPSGIPLASTAVPKESLGFITAETVMLPVTGLTASARYWIVAAAAGDVSDYVTWFKSNQVSGASTSSNGGATWAAQSYGLLYAIYDQSPVLPLIGTWEDSGARWTSMSYSGGELSSLNEFTAGQVANGYTVSGRVLSYSGGFLTGVA